MRQALLACGLALALAAASVVAGAGASLAPFPAPGTSERPLAVVPLREGEALSLAEVDAAASSDTCKSGHKCLVPGAVCCPGGEFCCRYGCDTSVQPIKCLQNPAVRQRALDRREKVVAKHEGIASQAKRAVGYRRALKKTRRAARKLSRRSQKCRRQKRRIQRLVRRLRRKFGRAKGASKTLRRKLSKSRKNLRKRLKKGRQQRRKRRGDRRRRRRRRRRPPSTKKLMKYSKRRLVAAVRRLFKQREFLRRRLGKAGVVRRFGSCKEIKAKNPRARSGRYVLRLRKGHLLTVHCDMETDGGGWTSLLNPATFPTATFPGLLFEPTTVSGTESCAGSDFVRKVNGWNTVYHYRCGNVVTRSHYRWSNVLNATDVMIRASLQGETVKEMSLNGRYVGFSGQFTPKADSVSKGSCVFYSGEEWSTEPGVNRCAATPVPQRVKPLVLNGWFAATDSLNLRVQSGKAALPSSQYGTGWNLATLMVR